VAELIAVTGASGVVGGMVARALAADGCPIRLVGRDPARFPDVVGERAVAASYRDVPAMTAALDGAQAMLLVSAREAADRMVDHRSAVDAAVAAGVGHVVYTSFDGSAPDCTFTFGRDHWHTEQYIRAAGLGFTFLRDNFYASLLPLMAGLDGARAVIRGPGGDGRLAVVAQADVAAVAATVLADAAAHVGRTYRLTGPTAVSLDEVAAALTERTGRPVYYQRETVPEAYASRAHYGAPPFEVDGWVSTYTAIANGELADVSPDVERLLGRRPTSFAEFLDGHPDAYAHLLGS
jgi:uncharacterized protein YbjT (DUF2867 family)